MKNMERNETIMKKYISIPNRKKSRGVAVIFTLGILGLLTVMALGFASTALLNRLTNDAGIKAFFDGSSKFKYLKADGTESSDEKSVKEILNEGGSILGNDDTTEAILFNGCQRFTRAVSLVDRVTY